MANNAQDQQPDIKVPSPEHQAELEQKYLAGVAMDTNMPYKGVKIRTLGELQWIMQQRSWSGQINLPNSYQRAKLSHVDLSSVNLGGVNLREADLRDASLDGVNLHNADLRKANLNNAQLYRADLSDTNLISATLCGANLGWANLSDALIAWANFSNADLTRANLTRVIDSNNTDKFLVITTMIGVNLEGAKLSGANLADAHFYGANLNDTILIEANIRGTNLFEADLSGADLREAKLDSNTILTGIKLSQATKLGDIDWNGANLTRVDWSQIQNLGDEQLLLTSDGSKQKKNHQERAVQYQDIARAYRGLANVLKAQSMNPQASRYRLLEQRWEHKAMGARRQVFAWLGSGLLDLVSGYGEQPGRIFISYLLVVLSFATAYFGVTHLVETGLSHLTWDESLVLSLTSFHGRGFFPGFLSLGDWVSRLAAFEAVIGLFIELILIATFSRRFLGN